MQQAAIVAIAGMVNAFPQSSADPDVLIRTFEMALDGIPDDVVMDVAQRYVKGSIEGQNRTFAPSVAEFTHTAKKLAEVRAYRALPAPRPTRHHAQTVAELPCVIRHKRRLEELAHRDVLYEGVNHDRYMSLSRARELPVGATWYWGTQCIYGPDKRVKQES